MGWLIKCTDSGCGKVTWAGNIVDLISNHRDGSGWFLCQCGNHGFIEKSFALQEPGEVWEPYLRGVIPLGDADDTYQPFVFLVSYAPDGKVNDVWFSYYKDLRPSGGRLKLGYGPGGPPVLGKQSILALVRQLTDVGCVTRAEIANAIGGLQAL
jgi:hypothetical protein